MTKSAKQMREELHELEDKAGEFFLSFLMLATLTVCGFMLSMIVMAFIQRKPGEGILYFCIAGPIALLFTVVAVKNAIEHWGPIVRAWFKS